MPERVHKALEKIADRKKLTGARRKRYINGALAALAGKAKK